MQTITLKVADDVSEKFLWLLSHFSVDEIEVLENLDYEVDYDFLETRKKLIQTQEKVMSESWDNDYDKVWNEL